MASYDLPATIHYVLAQSKQPKLNYVAFSQGTALGFACFSSRPDVADKVGAGIR